MFTLITETAKAKLLYINTHTSSRLKLTRYQIGVLSDAYVLDKCGQWADSMIDPNSIVIDDDMITAFTPRFTGTNTDIVYSSLDRTKSVFKMSVPPDYTYFKLNAVVLFARLDNEAEFPFLVSYNLYQNAKFSTIQNRFGLRYFHMLQLDLAHRDVRFDFTNLQYEAADFEQFHEPTLPRAPNVKQDQVIISDHQLVPENYKVFAVDSEGQHWGVLAQPWEYQTLTLNGDPLTLDGEPLGFGDTSGDPLVSYISPLNPIEPPLPAGSPASYILILLGL